MPEQPRIEQRDSQPYVAIPATVTMDGLPAAVDRLFPKLFGWLDAHGVTPADAPFIRYLRIDMDRELEIEVGAPVAGSIQPEDPVTAGHLPAGRYVTLLHTGPYHGLPSANSQLQQWGEEQGIRWQIDEDSRWGGRVERYITDPALEPDPARWQTEVAFLAAED